MRRTMKNFVKVIEKKERAAWRSLNFTEEKHGKGSTERAKAFAEWAALNSVKLMLESQDVFDYAYEVWMKD